MIEITEDPIESLSAYAAVPIAFEVREVLDVLVEAGGLGGLRLVRRPLEAMYVKDYDAEPGNHPSSWPARFDVSRWGVLSARAGGERVGGVVVAWETPGLELLQGRSSVAVLWDIRVAPAARGRGTGAALFAAAEAWCVRRGVRRLEVETQNVNVPACRFYARQGCELRAIHRFAYPALPGEAQLLWYKALALPEG